jgi:hypothetical protein
LRSPPIYHAERYRRARSSLRRRIGTFLCYQAGMADYYPLVATVAAALDHNTAEARRQLYENMRTGFPAYMGKIGRPLADAEVTPERTALEEAIRKFEAEQVALLARK